MRITIDGDIKPIELQVIGFQLQAEGITSLKAYQALGGNRQKALVQNYLESVIEDCGSENQNIANSILYILTDENNTRPSKTHSELETDLKVLEEDLLKEASQLDLFLYIFQKSGLVVLIPEIPSPRYQLVHDYLVSFIRAKRPILEKLVAELKAQREENSRTQEKLRISKLEKDKIELEKDLQIQTIRKQRLSVLLLLACTVSLFAFFIYSTSYTSFLRERERNRHNIRRAELYLDRARDLLTYNENLQGRNREVAMVEVIQAATLLLYQDNKYTTSASQRRVIESFQDVFERLSLDPENELKIQTINPPTSQDPSNLDSDELAYLLGELLNDSCEFISIDETATDILKERQGVVNLCPKSTTINLLG